MTLTESPCKTVQVTREGAVLRIELNNPKTRNSLTLEMYTILAETLKTAETDTSTRVVMIHGAGGNFTSGNDLMDFMKSPPTGEDSPVGRYLAALTTFPKPIVAAVSGHAIGVGTTMLLHCDLVLADPTARFRLPFVNLALVPEAASSFLLPGLIGHRRAAEAFFLGDEFTAHCAAEWGLVNRVCESSDLLPAAMDLAQRLAGQPPEALRLTKSLLKRGSAEIVQDTMRKEGELFRQRLASPEAIEAMSAFMSKRKPDFSKFS